MTLAMMPPPEEKWLDWINPGNSPSPKGLMDELLRLTQLRTVSNVGGALADIVKSKTGIDLPRNPSQFMDLMLNRDQKMMDAQPKPGTYPVAVDKFEPRNY
jgi:hypothetical protein